VEQRTDEGVSVADPLLGLLRLRIATKEQVMKPGTKDRMAGKIHEVKGAIKKTAGKITHNPDLEAEGALEKIAGQAQNKIGQVKRVFGT
jgi:uncharacterized protein YjbJ (UPF0337 family)